MESITISRVSQTFNISTRTLRYYEQIGLLTSQRLEDYAYRVYDEESIQRLQQIIILRKLRIPLKEIAMILKNDEQTQVIEIFQKNIRELDDEITSLTMIRQALKVLVTELNDSTQTNINTNLLQDTDLLKITQPLSLSKINFKEERIVEKQNKITEKLKNVRIILLPACTVASYHFIGENPEETVGKQMDKWIRESRLYEIKPDARLFGFNHPNPSENSTQYGYEDWVTIPEDMEVPAPYVKKHFAGGLYAAHTIKFGDFHEWQLLSKWVSDNEKYTSNYSMQGDEIMGGCLEEHLNWVYASHMGWPENFIDGQIDLLLPIKFK